MGVLPVDAQRFIYLEILARLNTATAEDALIWIVAVEGIGHIHFVGLRLVGNCLVLDMKEFGCVMHGTVAVVVVANGTVKQMVTEDAVKSFASRPLAAGM
jgi:hypothetical protein